MADEWETIEPARKVDTGWETVSNNDWESVDELERNTDPEVLSNLPDTLRVAFWDTGIEIPEEVSAALVGAGHLMTDTYRGVKQLMGIDEDTMKEEQKAMNALYSSSVSSYAKTGAVVGALAEPVGLLIPGIKTAKVGKAILKGTAIGTGFGALSYVDEEAGQTRLGNAMLGGTIGGTLTGALKGGQKVINTHQVSKATKFLDEVELKNAEKFLEGKPIAQIHKELQEELPEFGKNLSKSTETLGRKIRQVMTPEDAKAVVDYYKNPTKARDLTVNLEKVGGIVSTRVRNMSEPIAGKLREHDRVVLDKTHKLLTEADVFLKNYSKMFKGAEKEIVDLALLNGNLGQAKQTILRKGGQELWNEYMKVNKVLDNLGDELMSAGRITNKLEAYFPRFITDKEGLFKALGKVEKSRIETALHDANKAAVKRGYPLNPLEETQIINKTIRGYPIETFKPGFAKQRKIKEIPQQFLKYYARPEEALHSYIRNAVTDLEKMKFFGRHAKFAQTKEAKILSLDESIGSFVKDEMSKGKLSHIQQKELEHLLNIRFGVGEKSPSALTQDVKNSMYAMLLGNPISAATQLGDLGVSIYLNGFRNTLKGLVKGKVNVKDFGLVDSLAEEFASTRKSAKFLKTSFKYSGFSAIDRLGKRAILNGALNKYKKLAGKLNKPNEKGLRKIAEKYRDYYGKEFDDLVNDLQTGAMTDRVKLLLFSELADVQPISLSEVPEMYLRLPNGRIMYQLKTFMIKQLDTIRRDSYNEIKKGNVAKGLGNLARYGVVMGGAGAGSQYIKDWMLGKEVEPDLPADIGENFLKVFAWSEYLSNKIEDGKPVEAAMDVALPPFRLFDKVMQADEEALQYMPIAGKMWYYHFGGGLEKFYEREEQRELDRERRAEEG